jgi:L-ascorbate metabolism protein UlaG (beta-lactamase superfamily)
MKNREINLLLPVKKKNRYYNDAHDKPESFFFETLPTFIGSLRNRKKRLPENKSDWLECTMPLASSDEPVITWIGHASFLIQIAGVNIITDPIFGDASAFFPRILPPGIALDQLPRIDVVILSHNHRDHCDLKSLIPLQALYPNMTLLVPVGDKQWLQKKGFSRVIEHNWWDAYHHPISTDAQLKFTFLPARHWSAQGLFDRNKSLWGSWMISYEKSLTLPHIYFAGDTAYGHHFSHIAQKFPTINLALMPIAPGEPDPWMRKTHMDAHQAVQAFIDLNAQHFIPMHWGTFQFGHDTFIGPIKRLQTAWHEYALPATTKKMHIPKSGQRFSW